MKCLRCGVIYVSPQPSRRELTSHFADYAPKDAEELERRFEKNRMRPLARVAHYAHRKKSGGLILDVGCGPGIFLARFFAGSQWRSCGVELSRIAAAKAAEKKLDVRSGDIHAAAYASATFDFIMVLDAFYYFPEPSVELLEFARILRNDGVLIVELPSATSRIWRTSRRLGRWLSGSRDPLLFSSDHLFYYTPKSVSSLLQRCGFQILDVGQLPGNKQASLVRDLMFLAYFAFSRVMEFLSGSRILLGPRFFVAARKMPTVNEPGMKR